MYWHWGRRLKRWTSSRASRARTEELTGTPRHKIRTRDPRCCGQNGVLCHYNYNHNQVVVYGCDTWKLTKRVAGAHQQELEKHPNLMACGLEETVMTMSLGGIDPTLRVPDRHAAKRALQWNLHGKCKRVGDPITLGSTRDWKSWRGNSLHGMRIKVLDKTRSCCAQVQDRCSTRIGTERAKYRQVT